MGDLKSGRGNVIWKELVEKLGVEANIKVPIFMAMIRITGILLTMNHYFDRFQTQ